MTPVDTQFPYPLNQEGLLHRITNRIRQSLELQEILDTAVVEIRSFLGTDRVKIYRFYPDGHGEVIAESIWNEQLPSLLGLHFPADDIPPEAREGFINVRQRVIVDVDKQQTCLIALNDRQTGELLEQEDVRYRAVDPCHTEYLKAMGVRSSLVIPILHNEALWGLLASHHSQPHQFSEEALQVTQLVADQISIAIAQAMLLAQARSKAQREAAINKVAVSLHRLTTIDLQTALEDTVGVLNGSGGRLYRVADSADKATILHTCGLQPLLPATFQETVMEQHILWKEYFRPCWGDYTNPIAYNLKDLYAEPRLRVLAPAFRATPIRGLLVIPLEYRQHFLGYLSIFRDEINTEIVWAGQHYSDRRQEQPRNSFAAWKEQRRGQAVEWSTDDVQLAQALANQFAIAIYESDLYQQAQLENQQRRQIETTLRRQAEEDRLRVAILQRIRQSLNLETILDTTVAEVRQFLQTDRVLIYRFEPHWSGTVVAESVSSSRLSLLGQIIYDPCFAEKQLYLPYQHEHVTYLNDLQSTQMPTCYIDLLKNLHVQANLVVPILVSDWEEEELQGRPSDRTVPTQAAPTLWGLLIAHNCTAPRQWQEWEIGFLQQLGVQMAIALKQAELYQQVRLLNVDLEKQVQARTSELQQSLEYESLLKRITDKVRDSLDEAQILQTAVEELAQGLEIACCDAARYDLEARTSTICYEYLQADMPPAIGKVSRIDDKLDIYQQLLAGQCFQFCLQEGSQSVRRVEQRFAIFSCPILDDQDVLGDIWLLKPHAQCFDDLEVRLVQQVSNQCAIALRQARLYQASLAQVEELARLNQLKDDFLSTVSHELRTPMSSIKLATQMLEVILRESGILDAEDNGIAQYFQILNYECKREIGLINDLLDLTRLDAGSEPFSLITIDLAAWIPHLAESFTEITTNQQQHLLIQVAAELPPITTDLSYLERILTELLTNACKYTPAAGLISVTADLAEEEDVFLLRVSNTGIEIPAQERDRIFDKFYRIPNNDPWKHGGTGLGLALVKKLTEHLGGSIQVESQENQTTFTVRLPSRMTLH
ncbi:MAG: GAF domain-containing protein [Oscillatoriales cyanobacterium C42_A2020_001]|nr:GAF domain-containing protein [Leptolyngbyaceae cyanobacterium C42_A2020_001]